MAPPTTPPVSNCHGALPSLSLPPRRSAPIILYGVIFSDFSLYFLLFSTQIYALFLFFVDVFFHLWFYFRATYGTLLVLCSPVSPRRYHPWRSALIPLLALNPRQWAPETTKGHGGAGVRAGAGRGGGVREKGKARSNTSANKHVLDTPK